MHSKSRITFSLEPITADITAVTASADDAWLDNHSAALLETASLTNAAEQAATCYQCEKLELHCESERMLATTTNGNVELFSGDVLQVGAQRYQIKIQHTQPQPITKKVDRPVITFSDHDDIWSNAEEPRMASTTLQPFVRPQFEQPLLAKTSVTSMALGADPLDFLYQNHSSPKSDPNALLPSKSLYSENASSKLGIQPSSAPNGIQPVSEVSADFLEQAPMDHLDQYLAIDDERYHLAAATESSSNKPRWLAAIANRNVHKQVKQN